MNNKKVVNKFLHLFSLMRISVKDKLVFLTFDDGPEPDITEFVLNQLDKYGYKATFFCRGDNAVKFSDLYQMILEKGHSIGNHTFSHINSFETDTLNYIADVKRANSIFHSHLLRPPYGCITLSAFMSLFRQYKIVHWSLLSGDTDFNVDYVKNQNRLMLKTKKGDVVLFHCCKRHEEQTRAILPAYLEWLYENGYKSKELL